MKHSALNKIPAIVLWSSILITLIISVRFFIAYFSQSEDQESNQVSALLFWLFTLFIITVSTGLIFSFVFYIKQMKENPKKIGRFLVIAISSGLLFFIAWLLGSGNSLPLIGYKGSENTYTWLKITDMWLYSIYIILGIGFLALIGGIIWSYFKKLN